METNELSRRSFIGKTVAGALGVAVSSSALSMNAASYQRIKGANDRINIGFLGCGSRSRGHQNMVKTSEKDKNLAVVAVCDIWKLNREKAAANCKRLFGADVKQFKYSEDMLKMPGLDAVMIATGDFQHAKLLAEVVEAGKDCYCEKPLSTEVEDAKLARSAVLGSKQVVQMGSQWVSDPMQIKVRDIIRSGRLGQITKIEQVWNDNNHRWHDPNDPDITAIREEDTDWNRWLLGKPYEPFDPWKYFEFRIFREYSGGITSQWMSHGSGLVHFYTDTAIPDTMVANGGIFGWPDIRQNPDTFQALATYEDAKLLYSYSSSYANKFGDYTCIRGKDATLFAHGGEGSARWFLIPENQRLPGGFDFYEGMKEAVKSGKAEIVTTPEYGMKLGPVSLSDDSKFHLDNWIDCIRDRNFNTNGNIHTGYWNAIASIMATYAYRRGKKLYWDRNKEEIVDHPVI
ncbi:MAG TPA: Gfo/Idh/MocA family oxidoreductase [Bacteroidales bacterium]|jgi:predicted dehydrogenase|nr:Gfo/Idh/MocA family oxidoreductase [Bacteroidales bacterium]HQH23676.1 Gfo/Idh/MocA family oxidoreductase [Bacteroidales bacterium]